MSLIFKRFNFMIFNATRIFFAYAVFVFGLCPFSKGEDKSFIYIGNLCERVLKKNAGKALGDYVRVVRSEPPPSNKPPALGFDGRGRSACLGLVKVDALGTLFEVPSGANIILQWLDENFDMVFESPAFKTNPNEVLAGGDYFGESFSAKRIPLKDFDFSKIKETELSKKPDSLCGEYFSYVKNVQPILDSHCLACHDLGGEGASRIVLSGDRGIVFNRSYMELISTSCVRGRPKGGDESWGARNSYIVNLIRDGHQGVKMSEDEFAALRLWIDLDLPYYDTVEASYASNPEGRSPLTSSEIKKVFEICRSKSPLAGDGGNRISWKIYIYELLSFDTPEHSEILLNIRLNKNAYNEALSIVKRGCERLKKMPREDMENFEPNKNLADK